MMERLLIGFKILSILLIYLLGILASSGGEKIISLPNAECIPRETVVSVDAPRFAKKPSKVIIFRCDGSFEDMTPSLKKCVKNDSEILKLKVQNIFTLQSEVMNLENHTSCRHQCVFNGSQCNKNQIWDANNCRCLCNHDKQYECKKHFTWEPNLCQCVCDRQCPSRRQFLDEDECSCTCKTKFYKRCNRKKRILEESNCTCMAPERQIGILQCDIIPTKWAALIIVLSFFAIFIIAFDCILYTRRTGCFYHTTHLCHKENKNNGHQEETIPIKSMNSSVEHV